MEKCVLVSLVICMLFFFVGCSREKGISADINMTSENAFRVEESQGQTNESHMQDNAGHEGYYTVNTKISDVISEPAFGSFGRLIFPVNGSYYSGDTLGELRLTWYNNIDPDKTVEIVNYMKTPVEAGETIFYDIYTDEEKKEDPAKRNTGLFFLREIPVRSLQSVMQEAALLM